MKKAFLLTLAFLFLVSCLTSLAEPSLSLFSCAQQYRVGTGLLRITLKSSEGGRIGLSLRSSDNSLPAMAVGSTQIDAGEHAFYWNGLLPDGTPVPPGDYQLCASVQNYWGEVSPVISQPLYIMDSDAPAPTPSGLSPEVPSEPAFEDHLDVSALQVAEALSYEEGESTPSLPAFPESAPVPAATSFWDMNPDEYDLSNPDHQRAIWDLMMQPITVLDVGQTEHVYPTNLPNIKRTPYEKNTAGELHGQSQGVHVLEEDTDGDGYVLIEAFSNDGTKTENSYMMSIDNKRIQGYVKKSLLKTVQPSSKYAILIDKLRQKLFIFQNGAIIGELSISSGLNNPKQPYNESPAGDYITISKVGEFIAGTMRALYAIRINGGTLLHEVPYRFAGDGTTRLYEEFEKELGKKASHGCIRIQRRKNAQGQNMQWLWENLDLRTRVFIWDDQGRKLYEPELPDPTLQLYRNPNGGSNYHLDPNCSGVKAKFLPLTGDFTYGDLSTPPFSSLTPCVYCGAPLKPATLYERYKAAADQIGAVIPEEYRHRFGVQ